MQKLKQILLCAALMLMCALSTNAQGPGFGDDTVDEVPLDGGVGMLAAAAIGYGVKKLKDSRKDQHNHK